MPAPKSNTNALKHGLYAKQFNEDQRKGLRRMAWDDQRHEEFAARVHGSEILRLIIIELSAPVIDIDKIVKLSSSLNNALIASGTSARTHAGLNGEDPNINDALSEALGNFHPFEDDRTD
jgi:hypothetical protein